MQHKGEIDVLKNEKSQFVELCKGRVAKYPSVSKVVWNASDRR